MKNKLTILLFLACIGFNNAQTLSVDDMIILANCDSDSCIQNYLVAKGFSSTGGSVFHNYKANTITSFGIPDTLCFNYASYVFRPNENIIAFYTSDADVTKKILKDFKAIGFKRINTRKTHPNSSTKLYLNKNKENYMLMEEMTFPVSVGTIGIGQTELKLICKHKKTSPN